MDGMKLCHPWHRATSVPWNVSKQPPTGCCIPSVMPWTQHRSCWEGTEPLRTCPSAAAAQCFYSASLERQCFVSIPLPQRQLNTLFPFSCFSCDRHSRPVTILVFSPGCIKWPRFSTRETRGSKWSLVHTLKHRVTLTC